MSSINSDEIISILKSEIENFDEISKDSEVGTVVTVGDGIATIYGIDHAMYGEIVTFENGLKGMVQDIQKDEIGCILFGSDTGIKEGTKVARTKKKAGIPVGDKFIGRVINALGAPIDGAGEIEADDYRPIENEAPGIIDRKSVSVPMETGILSIDSMFPIGRGQRELIIGDRQTGKTSIATDTILNQNGNGVICIYVAIGQKASTISKVVNTFKTSGAMDHTIVLASTASDCAPLQYIAPYAGTALAEYFMYKGKDVLIVYDDLSKHAVAYRALSLLLGRSPGREAYPGDVFYLHSRLLERSSRLSEEKRRWIYHGSPDHRDTGRRCICIHSYKRYFHYRWTDFPGKQFVLLRNASGGQRRIVCISCRWRCTDKGYEEGSRKSSYRSGPVS